MVSAPRTLQTAPARTAPFTVTAILVAATAIVVLSQLYGAIPLFAPVQSAFEVDSGAAAWVQGAFGIAYAVGFIAWGPLVDRAGPRRVMLIGLVALTVTTALTPFAPSFPWLIAGRVLQGAVAASFAPAAFAYLGARVASERRGLSISVLTSSFLASAVIGQIVAQAVVGALDWRWFFWGGAVLLVLGAAAIRIVFLPDLPALATSAHPFRVLGGLLARAPVLVLVLTTVLVLGPMIALYTAIGNTGVTEGNTLLALRASALPALIWAPFGNKWLGRVAPGRRLVGAFLIAAVASVSLLFVSGSVVGVGIAMFVLAAAVAVAAPAMIQVLAGYAPEARGSITALYTCALFLGASLAPSLVATADASIATTAVAAAIASAIGGGLVLLSQRRTPEN